MADSLTDSDNAGIVLSGHNIGGEIAAIFSARVVGNGWEAGSQTTQPAVAESNIGASQADQMELSSASGAGKDGIRERVLANITANRAVIRAPDFNPRQGLLTMNLRALTTQAAQEVDSLGTAAFTARQQRAIVNYPNLGAAYRGSAIDRRVRLETQNDPFLRQLQGSPNRGPDFIDPVTGWWWDMTTSSQWRAHVNKYGSGGTLLPTR